jgi:hypothetical protein
LLDFVLYFDVFLDGHRTIHAAPGLMYCDPKGTILGWLAAGAIEVLNPAITGQTGQFSYTLDKRMISKDTIKYCRSAAADPRNVDQT